MYYYSMYIEEMIEWKEQGEGFILLPISHVLSFYTLFYNKINTLQLFVKLPKTKLSLVNKELRK